MRVSVGAASILAALLSASALADECSLASFEIHDFRTFAEHRCAEKPCPYVRAVGELVSLCPTPAQIQIRIAWREQNSGTVGSAYFWPIDTQELQPWESVRFDLRLPIAPIKDIRTFQAEVAGINVTRTASRPVPALVQEGASDNASGEVTSATPQAVEILTSTVWLALILVVYFLPAIVSGFRGHHNNLAIFWLNFLAGWTVIGWLIALIWALTAVQKTDGTLSADQKPRGWDG